MKKLLPRLMKKGTKPKVLRDCVKTEKLLEKLSDEYHSRMFNVDDNPEDLNICIDDDDERAIDIEEWETSIVLNKSNERPTV